MRNLLLGTLCSLVSTFTFAQSYWQQSVDYTIAVRLDDKKHELHGQESFVYTNNSPQGLDYLYIHLWPNAYRDGKSALGKQLYNSGEQLLNFGNDSIKGGIDSLNFTIDGIAVKWEYDSKHKDIAKLVLPKTLVSGGSVVVATPFKVKIPSGEISRLGHVGQSYQITQWYPKPAVYDKNGWNPIPYLNQGEFYSEYGTFDVSITLPKNYVVGATGDLQTESEIEFMNSLAGKTFEERGLKVDGRKSIFPASDTEMKTIRFKQKDVHDFGWFADKRFVVLKGEVEMPVSKRKVTSWALFTPANASVWKNSIEYINDGTYYYSKWNGEYPYNHVTAVDGTISAGGGMEYPNVTVIGNARSPIDLEIVIVHEVGHNWFYGIIGTNERVHGWMDEGLNTLNELRYVYTKYPNNKQLSDMVLGGRFHMNDLSHYDMADLTFRLIAGIGEDQPIETPSPEFTSANYGAVMYSKTGLVFTYLKEYLGEELFDKCMHAYFDKWKFQHPDPADLRAVVESVSGKNLDWLFGDLIQTTKHIDYKVKCVKAKESGTTVHVKSNGQVNGPISVSAYKDNALVMTKWLDPGIREVSFDGKMDEIRLNEAGRIPELNQSNNGWRRAGLFGKLERPKLEFLIGDKEPTRTNVFWTPMIAGNAYDKAMLGVVVHNMGVPFGKFQYIVMPLYSFGRQNVSGLADVSYAFHPAKTLKLSRFGLSLRSFKQTDVLTTSRNDGYYVTASPYWFAKLGNRKGVKPTAHTLLLQTMYRLNVVGPSQTELVGGFLKYDLTYARPDHKANMQLRTDYVANPVNGDQLGRVGGEATYSYRYLKNERKRWAEIRVYAGSNYLFDMYKTTSPSNFTLSLAGASGSQDIFTEDYYFGRTETTGFGSQQRLENMGAMKTTSSIGTNVNWIAASNIYVQLPYGPSFFGVFADFGAFPDAFTSKVNTACTAGLGIRLAKVLGVYVPLFASDNIVASQSGLKNVQKIRISLKLSFTNRALNFRGLL